MHVAGDGVNDQANEGPQNSVAVRYVEISAAEAGQRIDNFLIGTLKGVPRTHLYRLLRKGQVRVNGGRIKAAYRLAAGDRLRLPPLRVAERDPASVPRAAAQLLAGRLLHEDDDLLVLDKPSGMPVHAGSGVDFGVIEALRAARPGEKLELAHRLDRDTSGCLLVARNRASLQCLHAALREGAMQKTYLALASGRWRGGERRVDAALRKGTLSGGERMVRVDADGRAASSRFRPLERFADATLLRVAIDTGRTHQIRVHAAHLGHPLVGDDKYGEREANRRLRRLGLKRMFLHAWRLNFALGGRDYRLQAPLPVELETVLERLRNA